VLSGGRSPEKGEEKKIRGDNERCAQESAEYSSRGGRGNHEGEVPRGEEKK